MTSELKYYESELKRMADSVRACNIIEILDLADFFIAESNTNTTGIDKDIQDRIMYFTRKFKQNCGCKKRT
jgi:hypothetical protein